MIEGLYQTKNINQKVKSLILLSINMMDQEIFKECLKLVIGKNEDKNKNS